MAFPPDIGIAFNETIAAVQNHDRDWFLSPNFQPEPESRGPATDHQRSDTQRYVYRRGPRSLMELALEVVIENLHTITEQTIDNVPLPYLWRIYDECGPRHISFHTWKMLSKVLLADKDRDSNTFPPELYSYSVEICSPSFELSYYTQPLVSSNVDFLSYLTIKGIQTFQTDELLVLAKLRNLVVLEIIENVTHAAIKVTDRLIKGWSETEDAFPLLQNLRISGLMTSYRSLQYLSKFPSLTLYEICNGGWSLRDNAVRDEGRVAKNLGWSLVGSEWEAPSESLLPALEVPPKMRTAHLRLLGSRQNSTRMNPQDGFVFRRIKSSLSGGRLRLEDKRPEPKDAQETQLKPRKRQKMQDLLTSFGG